MRTFVTIVLCGALAAPVLAQGLAVSAIDTAQTVVAAQKGKRVTLRLRSGQEVAGTVRDVSERLIVLEAVAGRELFDAVVPVEAVEAVFVKVR